MFLCSVVLMFLCIDVLMLFWSYSKYAIILCSHVHVFLPQPDGGVVVGSAQELAKRSKGSTHASAPTAGKPVEPVLGEGEGVFPGMERLSMPRGSVMVWDNAQAEGGTTFTVIPEACYVY